MERDYYLMRKELEAIKPKVDFFYKQYGNGYTFSAESGDEAIRAYVFLTLDMLITIRQHVYCGLDMPFHKTQHIK